MDNLENLLERVKQFLLNNTETQIYNSKDFTEEEFGNLEDNEHRITYMIGFERSDPFMYVMYILL